MVRVLFVCMGGVCRAPLAEGIFQKLVGEAGLAEEVLIDSAGTHPFHEGRPVDERTLLVARQHGVDLSYKRARQIVLGDFEEFDLILAADEQVYRTLLAMAPSKHRHKLGFLLDYAPHLKTRTLPDPYYGPESHFYRVLDMIEDACRGLLEDIRKRVERA